MHLFTAIRPSFLFLALAPVVFSACHPAENTPNQAVFVANSGNDDFSKYWFAGEAELCTYETTQSRYGEQRPGEAVLVFVTEDFSAGKHVKLDAPDKAGKDKVPVMKMNQIRRFVTGIYDYSMMLSVFTPIDLKLHAQTLKTTMTSQDWCGHTFTQLNLDGAKYRVSGFSYFESEGDDIEKVATDLLEDELWTRLRVTPESIPSGVLNVVPSSFFARLQHQELAPKQARIRFEDKADMTFLVLEYLHINRSLHIGFESKFPYKILEWKEEMDGVTTSAGKLKATIKSAYWQQHDNVHEHLRDTLRMR